MAHQEGYEDRWEQHICTRTAETATGLSQKQKHTNKKKTKEKDKQEKNNKAWGNKMKNKQPDTVRIFIQNAGRILPTKCGQLKLDRLKLMTQTNQIDICTMTETNANWNKVPPDQHPRNGTRGWWECAHWTMTCNRNKKHQQEYRPGGPAIAIINKTAHRAMQSGEDKSGLGR